MTARTATAVTLARDLCRILDRPAVEIADHEMRLAAGRPAFVWHDHIDITVEPDGTATVHWRSIPPARAVSFIRWLRRTRRL